jgi:ATP-binding cassette, subfamily C, bacterial CydC
MSAGTHAHAHAPHDHAPHDHAPHHHGAPGGREPLEEPAGHGHRFPLLASLSYGTTARPTLLAAAVGALAQHAGTVAAAASAGWLVGAAAGGYPAGRLTAALTVLTIAVTAAAVGTWANGWFGHAFAFRYQADLRLAIFDGMERSAPRALLGRRTGDLAAVAMGDVDTLETFYAHLGITATVAAVVSAAAVAMLGVLHPVFAAITATGLIILAVVPVVLARRGQAAGAALRTSLGDLNAEVVDGVQGIRELTIFRQVPAWTGRVGRLTRRYQGRQLAQGRAAGLQAACTDLIMSVTAVAVLVTAVAAEAGHQITLPAATMAVTLTIGAVAPVAEAAGMASALAPLRAAARRVMTVADQPAAVPDTGTAVPSGQVTVAFDHVTFSYEPGRPILNDVSFTASPGELVAIVGRTGAGKTTCANLLLRFWDPDAGTVTLNGIDLHAMPLAELRRQVAVVPQDVYLFATTVADNLRLASPDATSDQLEAAARAANAHDFITALPEGYDAPLTERAARLSGGERQRLAIARALLRDAPVLLMDEASANLDTENERDIQAAIRTARGGRTTLVIAHRLSTIRAADRIVFLENGQVAAVGAHDELLAASPAYAALVAHQLTTEPAT